MRDRRIVRAGRVNVRSAVRGETPATFPAETFMKILLFSCFALAASIADAASDPSTPAPFSGEYVASRNGESLGRTTLELRDNHDGTWTLRSETRGTEGLAKLAGVHIVETSHFRWRDGRPEAIDYDYKQDSAVKQRTRHAVFKGDQAEVEEGGETFKYAIVPGLIDRHAVTLAIASDLKRSAKTFDYKVAVKDHVEDMRYVRGASEKRNVPAGEFDAVLVSRDGEPGEDRKRVSRSWFAPSLGWMPVEIEQNEKKGDTVTLRLAAVHK